MVGVINPTNGTSIDKQIQSAMGAKLMLTPGQSWPAEGTQPGSANTTSSASAPNATNTNTPGITHNHKLSAGAIAGISIAAAAVVLLCAALCYFVGRSNSYKDIIKHQNRPEGGLSQTGDSHPSPWTPAPVSPSAAGGWDNRFSGQTQYSQITPQMGAQGPLVGYNRLTGLPEYAAEAPTDVVNEKRLSPVGHLSNTPGSTQETAYELPGEQPPVAEVGPYK
jgi:hypothetical protein